MRLYYVFGWNVHGKQWFQKGHPVPTRTGRPLWRTSAVQSRELHSKWSLWWVIVGRMIRDWPSVDMDMAPHKAVLSVWYFLSLYLFKTGKWGNPNLLFHPEDIITTSGLTFSRNCSELDVRLPWCGAKSTVLFNRLPAIETSSFSALDLISPGNRNDVDPNLTWMTSELLFVLRHRSCFLLSQKLSGG